MMSRVSAAPLLAALLLLPGLAGALRMSIISPGSKITILGPANKPVQLIAGKIASKAGYQATVLVEDNDALNNARMLSYGRDYAANGVDESGKLQFAVGADQLGRSLEECEGVVIAAGSNALPRSFIETALRTPNGLKRAALLSTQGGSETGLKETEDAFKEIAKEVGAEYSIVRTGLPKGGGPGNVARGDEFGLNEFFYNTNADINQFQKDKFADQYLLGVKLSMGDSVRLSFMRKLVAANSFSFSTDGNTNRIASASALLQTLTQESVADLDFSVSSYRGLLPPSEASWAKAFADMRSSDEGVGITEYAEDEIPEATPTPGERARALQMQANLGDDVEQNAEAMDDDSPRSFKMGASSRAEELKRKQVVGHFIPVGVTAAAVAYAAVNNGVELLPGVPIIPL